MIRRAIEEDREFIKGIYENKIMTKYLTDDNCPRKMADCVDMILKTPVIYAMIYELEGARAGLFLYFPWNYTTYELHVTILPEYRGIQSISAAKESAAWVFKNTCCHKIVVTIPKPNYKAKALAILSGMQQEGINRKSYMKDGKLYDMYLFGICKEELSL
jgi:RimJ/RimL family protein N-acetyltransferase